MAAAPQRKGRPASVVPIKSTGTMAGLAAPAIVHDRIRFRSQSEVAIYKAPRVAEARLPEYRTLAIAPNATLRVRGHTWEIDFLITYEGRCGAIEVDGHTHQNRWVADRSRDRLLQDAGVYYVDRIDAAEALDEREASAFVERVLDRLAR